MFSFRTMNIISSIVRCDLREIYWYSIWERRVGKYRSFSQFEIDFFMVLRSDVHWELRIYLLFWWSIVREIALHVQISHWINGLCIIFVRSDEFLLRAFSELVNVNLAFEFIIQEKSCHLCIQKYHDGFSKVSCQNDVRKPFISSWCATLWLLFKWQ